MSIDDTVPNANTTAPEADLNAGREYFSIAELAQRWRCSRGTVYNRLRAVGAEVLDFAARGKKGKKLVAAKTILHIEQKRTRRLR